ncbi:hypothetical protein ACFFX1_29890 [Dactylosporangium sucinum]|uniref:Uncharacterized protein n=1 Tax=Dactylosporangium sucinum TaxID=1424081 RepID=A0A917U9I5_9ACTN|nr:hypothetical protein [Dactylosporangium sucinum]GGM68782.1 hypothetical protein GCM10007977_083120 [Dactylosporangium sucinum]
MSARVQGWPFAVARTATSGYRLLLVPPPLADPARRALVQRAVAPGDDADGPATRRVGSLTLVYRTHRLLGADEHGRPLVMVYGFASPGRVAAVADEDLRFSLRTAQEVYRGERATIASPFPLASSVEPARLAGVGRPRRRAPLVASVAVVLLVAALIGAWAALRPGTPDEVWRAHLTGEFAERDVTVTIRGGNSGSVDDGTGCDYGVAGMSTGGATTTVRVTSAGADGCLPGGRLELVRAARGARIQWYGSGETPVMSGTATSM